MPSILGLQPTTLIQAVLDNVGVAFAIVDKEGNFVLVNQAFHNMFGEKNSMGGVPFEEWHRGYRFKDSQDRDIPSNRNELVRALAGEEVEPGEVHVILPDGRTKWLHIAGSRFSVLGLDGVLVIVTDETEQVELRRATEHLQRMEAVGLLAGGLVHDFNNMLSVISENIALSLAEPDVAAATRDRLHQVTLALEKGAGLAGRLVQFSRTPTMQRRPLHVNEVVNTALELVRPLLEKRVRVRTELACSLPAVMGDPAEIEQVLVNLILNALDAMPEGGDLALCTEVAPPDVVSAGEKENAPRFVLITVADTGIGIPKNLQDSIFDPFFTTKPDGRGAGMGLSSACRIVRQHRGHIKVHSAPGTGAKFSIYLPAGSVA